mmetsp:Transcript_43933/g.111125  ORF Transcript_43933/g.111125 Transcript_43933/m.111125 type:complete len:349 (+) Transcript_43933:165-1211(+)
MAGRGSEYDDLEVVAVGHGSFEWLASWEPFVKPYRIIAVHLGEPGDKVGIPAGLNADLYNRTDFERVLGRRAWIFGGGKPAGRAAVSFGVLLAKRRFVLVLEEGCLVGKTPGGERINALRQHVQNLITPATPYFFNTLYDPYRQGSDFVRGYPFTLRPGVQTAISHGLWNNVPDYDGPTRMCKTLERNDRYVDAVLTVPKGTLFPMSARNLAFDRQLIGAAMFFGLDDGEGAPALYPDIWAGWCAKVICDHLGIGIKSGLPYVWCAAKEKEPLAALEDEQAAILLQEELIPFFQRVQFSEEASDPIVCYRELSEKVRAELSQIGPYFEKLADAMMVWLECWKDLNPDS